jgi:RHS repeat-associated protein
VTGHANGTCWTSKPGNSSPPASIERYISVIVSTSIVKNGGSIDGNIAAVVVVRVDASPAYGNDPGKPGYGTIVAVITDGARLFSTSTPAPSYAGYFFRHLATPRTQIASLTHPDLATLLSLTTPTAHVTSVLRPTPLTVAAGTKRYSFYTPDMHLLAETALTSSGAPTTAYEYIWFNGHPVAQIDAGAATHWTFTDHLGTPILLTNTDASTYWRAEYEPFGAVYALRSPDIHQPLRLPGQEAEQINLGANGVTEREYNIFRWYRGGWGRYSQADPMGLNADTNLFRYANDNPGGSIDPLGLYAEILCRSVNLADQPRWVQAAVSQLANPVHCRLHITCCDGSFDTTVGLEVRNRKYSVTTEARPAGQWSRHNVWGYGNGPDCTFERCALRAAENYNPYPYDAFGIRAPNSNTFVRRVIDQCGGKGAFPSTAFGSNY